MRIFILAVFSLCTLFFSSSAFGVEQKQTTPTETAPQMDEELSGSGLYDILKIDIFSENNTYFSTSALEGTLQIFATERNKERPVQEKLFALFGSDIYDTATIFEVDELIYFLELSQADYEEGVQSLKNVLQQSEIVDCGKLVDTLSVPVRQNAIAVLGAIYAKNARSGITPQLEEHRKASASLVILSQGGAYFLDYLHAQKSTMEYLKASEQAGAKDEGYALKEIAKKIWDGYEEQYRFTDNFVFSKEFVMSQIALRDSWENALVNKELVTKLRVKNNDESNEDYVKSIALQILGAIQTNISVESKTDMDEVATYKNDRLYLNPAKMLDSKGGIYMRILLVSVLHEATHYVQKEIMGGSVKVSSSIKNEVENHFKFYMHPKIIERDFELLYFLQPMEAHANFMGEIMPRVMQARRDQGIN